MQDLKDLSGDSSWADGDAMAVVRIQEKLVEAQGKLEELELSRRVTLRGKHTELNDDQQRWPGDGKQLEDEGFVRAPLVEKMDLVEVEIDMVMEDSLPTAVEAEVPTAEAPAGDDKAALAEISFAEAEGDSLPVVTEAEVPKGDQQRLITMHGKQHES